MSNIFLSNLRFPENCEECPKLHACTWTWTVGKWISFWGPALFSGSILAFLGVCKISIFKPLPYEFYFSPFEKRSICLSFPQTKNWFVSRLLQIWISWNRRVTHPHRGDGGRFVGVIFGFAMWVWKILRLFWPSWIFYPIIIFSNILTKIHQHALFYFEKGWRYPTKASRL